MKRHIGTLALAAAVWLAGPARAADLNGTLDWAQRTDLALSVSGLVGQVEARPGQTVRQGDLLLALQPALFKARVAEARAEMERATEEEADARKDLERANELYARTVSSTTELDAARLRQARARAGLAAAQARLEQARQLLAESELRAPFDGVVLDRRAEPGMAVSAQCQPPVLITLARADRLLARAPLPADLAAGLLPGGAVRVQANGRVLEGSIAAVRHLGEAGYLLEVSLPREKGLRPGLAATLRLQP